MADSLPNEIDRMHCAHLSRRVPKLITVNWKINQDVIFPALLRSHDGDVASLSERTARRLTNERLTDQGYALEVSELLAGLAVGRCGHEMNAVGYLLRSFFEVSRRTAAFELEFIVPAAQRHLKPPDLTALAVLLNDHRTVLPEACLAARAAAFTTR